MKKRFLILAAALIGSAAVYAGACTAEETSEFLTPGVSAGVQINEDNHTMILEARVTSSIPQAAVTDKDGNILEGYTVTRTVTDKDGNKKSATLTMQHGETLTVKYTATNGEKTLEKTYEIQCFDTIKPALTFLNLSRAYQIGGNVSILPTQISDDLDYAASSIVLKNENDQATVNVPFDGGYTFTAESAAKYTLTAKLKDLAGNETTIINNFTVVGAFEDANVDDYCLWDFNEDGYLSNVAFSADGDEAAIDIVEDTAEAEKVKALKISAKAGESYDITFNKGKKLVIYEQEYLTFRVRSKEVVDIFEVYNADDGVMYDLSWKTGGYEGYTVANVPISALFNEGYALSEIRVKISTETNTDIYLDYIGYADPAPMFVDEDLSSQMLAAFDENGYTERLSAASSKDHTTFNASWTYVSESEAPAGNTNGAIRFVSMTDPATTSDKQTRDGFTYKFMKRMKASDFKTLSFRIYCAGDFENFTMNFLDKKKGETSYLWLSNALGVKGEWVTIKVPQDKLAEKLGDCENIVSVSLRFHRRKAAAEGAVLYLDNISNAGASFEDFNYDFSSAEDLDFYAAKEYNGGTVTGIVADEAATNGFALKAVTAYGTKVGVQIVFNDIDISKYTAIKLRIRTSHASSPQVSLFANGTSLNCWKGYATYTDVDLIPLMKAENIVTLSSLEIVRNSVAGIEIYVDKIEFIEKQVFNYDFSSADDNDINAASVYSTGTIEGIVADSAAKDGYALKITTGTQNGNGGAFINFDDLDVSKYEKITIRLRTETSNTAANQKQINIGANGANYIGGYGMYSEYTEIDVLKYLQAKSIAVLSSLAIYRNVPNITVYIDCIELVEKA
mgnify:FL=1